MVINSPFFERDENFVHKAELSTQKGLKSSRFHPVFSQKPAFGAKSRDILFKIPYEYAKTTELPFRNRKRNTPKRAIAVSGW